MAEKASTYSTIIRPEDYNRIITFEHVYIFATDQLMKVLVEKYRPTGRIAQVVEIGCGPARMLPLIGAVPGISLTGVDYDTVFVDFAQREMKKLRLDVQVISSDFLAYIPTAPVDIYYSQGVHHHVGKAFDTQAYLTKVATELTEDGVYLLSDEFLPNYADEKERKIKAVIWYSFVIAHALRGNFAYLAQEEAKTLIDDLHEGMDDGALKDDAQIQLVLSRCADIEAAARAHDFGRPEALAQAFLHDLFQLNPHEKTGDAAMDLSRGDFKICDTVLREEIHRAGFEVVERHTVGPVDTIGGMGVYVLKKKKSF